MPWIPERGLAALLMLAACRLPAQTGGADTFYLDAREDKQATLMVVADANFSAKQVRLGFQSIGNGGGFDAQSVGDTIIYAALEYATKETLSSYIPTLFGWLTTCPYGWALSAAEVIWAAYALSAHVRERNYVFVAPVAGRYQLKVWVPGDWDKPCSMIKVFSVYENVEILKYSYDKSNASNREEIISVDLPARPVRVSVSVGSGTLNTHTAGHMVDAMLNNPTNVQWTVPHVLVDAATVNIGQSLPLVGSVCVKTLQCSAPGTLGGLINGSVAYSNYVAIARVQHLPPAHRTLYLMYALGDPAPPSETVCIVTNMDAEEASAPLMNGQTVTYHFRRLPDFVSVVNTLPRPMHGPSFPGPSDGGEGGGGMAQ